MTIPDIVQTHGRCELRVPHEAHVFLSAEYATHRSFWDCPGQYADCANCDDRKCMSCVFREIHDACEDDCPECCGDPE